MAADDDIQATRDRIERGEVSAIDAIARDVQALGLVANCDDYTVTVTTTEAA